MRNAGNMARNLGFSGVSCVLRPVVRVGARWFQVFHRSDDQSLILGSKLPQQEDSLVLLRSLLLLVSIHLVLQSPAAARNTRSRLPARTHPRFRISARAFGAVTEQEYRAAQVALTHRVLVQEVRTGRERKRTTQQRAVRSELVSFSCWLPGQRHAPAHTKIHWLFTGIVTTS